MPKRKEPDHDFEEDGGKIARKLGHNLIVPPVQQMPLGYGNRQPYRGGAKGRVQAAARGGKPAARGGGGQQLKLLKRLAYKLAPTAYQQGGQMKQQVRQKLYADLVANDMEHRNLLQIKGQPFGFDYDRATKIMGKGGYWGRRIGGYLGGLTGNSTIKNFGAQLGDYAGDALGAAIPYGNQLAGGAEAIARLSGHGGYRVGETMQMQPASFAGGDVESIRVQAREYLGAVKGSDTFLLKTLRINAGDMPTFPRLSKLAQHYEQYKFNGLVLWFHSTSGESTNSADTAIGEIMMSTTPNSIAAAPQNKAQLVRMDSAAQGKPSIDMACGVECKDELNAVKYIRHGEFAENTADSTEYDLGRIFIATEGMNAAVTRIGELWITYDVTLIRARDTKGQEVATYSMRSNPASNTNLWLNHTVYTNTIGLELLVSNAMAFPEYICDGDYQITMILKGPSGNPSNQVNSVVFPQLILAFATPLITPTTYIPQDQAYAASGPGTAISDVHSGVYRIRVNAPGTNRATFQFGSTTSWPFSGLGASAAAGYVELLITEIPATAFPSLS